MLGSIIPRLSGAGLIDYMALAVGLSLGFALLKAPMDGLEKAISKQ